MWEVDFTDEFGNWWETLTEDEQESLTVSVKLLQVLGPALGRPHADTVRQSKHKNMKDSRLEHFTHLIRAAMLSC